MLVEKVAAIWTSVVKSGENHLREYYLVHNPVGIIAILGFYTLFVFKVGPSLMKNRTPLELKHQLMAFNIAQIILNAILLYLVFPELRRNRFNMTCYDYDSTPTGQFAAKLLYFYGCLKVFDLFDTVFFVLRKRDNQVTFLHVYHHISMVLGTWILCKWLPGGHILWVGPLNTTIHIIMYFYYFLTVWKPEYKKNIWWKKYITQLQMVQHVTAGTLMVIAFFNPNCRYSKITTGLGIVQALMMVYLFGNFYVKAYTKKPKKL